MKMILMNGFSREDIKTSSQLEILRILFEIGMLCTFPIAQVMFMEGQDVTLRFVEFRPNNNSLDTRISAFT